MKKRIKQISCYSISALLFVWYLVIFVQGIYPEKVCDEYRKYYVENKLTDWPGYDGLAYQVSTPVVFTNDSGNANQVKRRGNGWGELLEDGCFITGERADLYYRNLPEKDLEVQIISGEVIPDVTINVLANDESIYKIILKESRTEYNFVIPQDTLQEGELCLSFEVENYSGEQNYFNMKNITLY